MCSWLRRSLSQMMPIQSRLREHRVSPIPQWSNSKINMNIVHVAVHAHQRNNKIVKSSEDTTRITKRIGRTGYEGLVEHPLALITRSRSHVGNILLIDEPCLPTYILGIRSGVSISLFLHTRKHISTFSSLSLYACALGWSTGRWRCVSHELRQC